MDGTGTEELVNEIGGGNEEAVRVFVRIRPLNSKEKAEKQTIGWNCDDTSMSEDTQNGQRNYSYDHCFGPSSTNQETYDIVGKPVVLKAMEGYNGTVFTYGQTGSGKTWTMRGCDADPGMMILCVRDILDWVKSKPHIHYIIRIAYIEVYNEEINDLLGDGGPSTKNLKIVQEDAAKGVVIGGLIEEEAKTAEDFMEILRKGEASRSYASTGMNDNSSRSHVIYRVSIEAIDKEEYDMMDPSKLTSGNHVGRVSYLNLVDLAGSERQKSTKAEGKVLKEGANINKSLLALGAVINKLGELSKRVKGGKPVFIPYRDSKLTRILKQSLGGNTLTSVLCAVTPAPMHREETVSTLKFGQLCKSIKNQVKSNEILNDKDLIKQYKNTVAELQRQLEEMALAHSGGSSGGSGVSGGVGTGGNLNPEDVDPDTVLGQVMKEKMDLEVKVRSLENMLLKGGPSGAFPLVGMVNTSGDKEEIARLNEKITEQARIIAKHEATLNEYADLAELKASIEEYEHHSREELQEDTMKLEKEKQTLQNERYKLLRDRTSNDEKESRIGSLITLLDEKESKLRQLMGTMKEQQEQWKRSVTDLQRREDLVEDWQNNHRQREKRLQEIDAKLEQKASELKKRELDTVEQENIVKMKQQELSEREQRLQVAQSRVANSEQHIAHQEEKLNHFESVLKKREADSDTRDRELSSRRKEMESWDVLLREKDRKIAADQRDLDERVSNMRVAEEKYRIRDAEFERRMVDLKQAELQAQEQMALYTALYNEEVERNKESKERELESILVQQEQERIDNQQQQKEKQLLKMAEMFKDIDRREADLTERITAFKQVEDEFYNVKVRQIASRHKMELASLEALVSEQIKIVADSQRDLKAAQSQLKEKTDQCTELENTVEQYSSIIEDLRERLLIYEDADGTPYNNAGDDEDSIEPRVVKPVRRLSALTVASSDDLAGLARRAMRSNTLDSEDEGAGAGEDAQRGGSRVAPRPGAVAGLGNTATSGFSAAMGNSVTGNSRKSGKGHAGHHNGGGHGHGHGGGHGNGSGGGGGGGGATCTGVDVMQHLAMTHKILYYILDKHNALPDKNGGMIRRGPLAKSLKKSSAVAGGSDAVTGSPDTATAASGGARVDSGGENYQSEGGNVDPATVVAAAPSAGTENAAESVPVPGSGGESDAPPPPPTALQQQQQLLQQSTPPPQSITPPVFNRLYSGGRRLSHINAQAATNSVAAFYADQMTPTGASGVSAGAAGSASAPAGGYRRSSQPTLGVGGGGGGAFYSPENLANSRRSVTINNATDPVNVYATITPLSAQQLAAKPRGMSPAATAALGAGAAGAGVSPLPSGSIDGVRMGANSNPTTPTPMVAGGGSAVTSKRQQQQQQAGGGVAAGGGAGASQIKTPSPKKFPTPGVLHHNGYGLKLNSNSSPVPHTTPTGATDLSSIMKTSVRNGVTVTTVNLGSMKSPIRHGTVAHNGYGLKLTPPPAAGQSKQ